jgi:hypothetical protein
MSSENLGDLNGYRNLIHKLLWIVMVVFIACASRQATSASPLESACRVSPEILCQSAAGTGISLCSPPGPATIGTIVCESEANGNPLGELPADVASMVENGTATQTISVPFFMPDGEVAAVAACAINRRHNSVVYAVVTRGPTTQAQADYLRENGTCVN